jgi:transposase
VIAYLKKFRRKLLSVMEKEGLTIEEGAKRFDVGTTNFSILKCLD